MRAVLCGYYGMGNGGDEALLASLLQMLPQRLTPLVLSGNPQETSRRYGVEACPRKSAVSLLGALRRSDVFIWGGGSLMQDATSALNPFYYGGLMGLAQGMGLKTIAWAQGIGPLQRGRSRWIAKRALKGCMAVSVRDRTSAQLLNDWRIPAWLAPDPVWALQSQPVSGLWDLPAPRVAVALRAHPWLTVGRLGQLTQALIDFQKATQTCILLLPFQPSVDRAIAQTIQTQLPGPNKLLCLADPKQLKGVFRGVEMVIGMRFHALVMAAAEGCRCFGLSYDPKISQLMKDLNLPGWDLNPTSSLDASENTRIPPFPDASQAIGQSWINHYANGDPLSDDQVYSLVDRALMHQDLLNEAFAKLER